MKITFSNKIIKIYRIIYIDIKSVNIFYLNKSIIPYDYYFTQLYF